MNRTTTAVASLTISLAMLGAWNVGAAIAQEVPPTECVDAYPDDPNISTCNTPDGECHEDMPCWDCETMGNLICGPAQVDEPLVILAPAPIAVESAPLYNG